MEFLLSIVVVGLLMVFGLMNDKKAKQRAEGRAANRPVNQRAVAPRAVKPRAAKPRVAPTVQAIPIEAVQQGAAMLDDTECAGGSMAHAHTEGHGALEDEECVGGSMEHTHTEGVSRAEHARRLAAIDAEASGDVLPEVIDARTLRRAVVMAEVLGKPRALRRG